MARRDAADRARAGSGFTFKWNMGWMHDTLDVLRDATRSTGGYHQDQLTFAMMYEHSEHFIMPLSHDEVVHLKGSLLREDAGRRLAEARQPARAARVPVHAAGQEAAVHGHASSRRPTSGTTTSSLHWHLLERPVARGACATIVARLGARVPRASAALAARRRARRLRVDRRRRHARTRCCRTCAGRSDAHVVVVLNLTPVPHARLSHRRARGGDVRARARHRRRALGRQRLSAMRRACASRTTCRITGAAFGRAVAAAALGARPRAGARGAGARSCRRPGRQPC